MPTYPWPVCSLEAHCTHMGMPHRSQNSSHSFEEWIRHKLEDSRFWNGMTLCTLDRSERCSSTHALHRYMWQMSQYIGGLGDSQRRHRNTSWALSRGSMIRYLDRYKKKSSEKRTSNDFPFQSRINEDSHDWQFNSQIFTYTLTSWHALYFALLRLINHLLSLLFNFVETKNNQTTNLRIPTWRVNWCCFFYLI